MKIKNNKDLKQAIEELERKRDAEKENLGQTFSDVKESMKPANLVKSSFKKVKESPGLKGSLIAGAIAIGLGIATKKMLTKKSSGVAKKIVGAALKMGLAGVAANNSAILKSSVNKFFKRVLRSKSNKQKLQTDPSVDI